MLIGGLQKARSQKVMREQSGQLKRQSERDEQLTILTKAFQDPLLTRSLYSPSLQNYSRLFVMRSVDGLCCDQYVLLNGNGICVVGLAESHHLIRNHMNIVQIAFGVGNDNSIVFILFFSYFSFVLFLVLIF